MAVIRSIKSGPPTERVHPSETDALMQVVRPASGVVLLQLSTFGSDDRQSEPKVSQTIQLDKNAALALRAFIDATFGSHPE